MEAEQIEIASFLKRYPPFNELPSEELDKIALHTEIGYYRAGSTILTFGDPLHEFCVIRSGKVELYRSNKRLFYRLASGDIFGQWGLMMKRQVRYPAVAIEDSLIYFLPEAIFDDLFERYEVFSEFMETKDSTRIRQAIEHQNKNNGFTTVKVSELIWRDPVSVDLNMTVQQVAKVMAEKEISSVLVTSIHINEGGSAQPKLEGVFQDKDLRTKVMAAGLPYHTPIRELLSRQLITLDSSAYVFEAMLSMLRNNIYQLPIMKEGEVVGVLGFSEILRYESRSSLMVVSSIFMQHSVEDLALLAKEVSACFRRLVSQDANSHMIGSAMSVIGRSFKQRLIELAENQLGKPPVPYCFVIMGSMARDEQLIVTDQDNALILDDSYRAAEHGSYFAALAKFVCDGLAKCGYNYCSGGIMASNPKWRKTRYEWRQAFADWMEKPNPRSLLDSNIFFDLDGVYGMTSWVDELKLFIARKAPKHTRFLAAMACNALNRTPPLGFFKNFVLENDGQQRQSINLKRRGTAPLVDLVRIHALAIGSTATNSFDRINDIIDAGLLPKGRGEDLRDAMEFISMVRIRHQAFLAEQNRVPDNSIEPALLSDFERRNLKDAFQILSNSQKFLRFRYHPTRTH